MDNYVYYYTVCMCCGKRMPSSSKRPERSGPPTSSPFHMGGTCPSSPDGKHKPRWVKG